MDRTLAQQSTHTIDVVPDLVPPGTSARPCEVDKDVGASQLFVIGA
jgi:hypothetical protein